LQIRLGDSDVSDASVHHHEGARIAPAPHAPAYGFPAPAPGVNPRLPAAPPVTAGTAQMGADRAPGAYLRHVAKGKR